VGRSRISRADYLFGLCMASIPGLVAIAVIALADAIGLDHAIGGTVLVVVGAAAVAWPWARDAGALRTKAAKLGTDDAEVEAFASRTPIGDQLFRQMEEARRRLLSVQRNLEARALDAERIIDTLPDPLLVLNDKRRVVHGNLSAERLLGSDLAGRSLAEVIRSPDVLEAVEECIDTREPAVIEFDLMRPVERQMVARIAPQPRAGTNGEALLLALQDWTAVRRADQMRVDFIANVSHELRTPLTSLSGFIETLQTVARDDPEGRDRFLAIMAAETRRLNRLVDDLMSLSRIEQEEHNPPADVVHVKPVVDSMVGLLAGLASENGTTVTVDIQDDVPTVIGDADQLAQVVRNLLENAIKYGREKGHVHVSAASKGGFVEIAVADDGEGIPREFQHRLTERFYRVEKARSRRVGGTGLGLAIVKHIVNRHRGRLQIESEPGKGSTFRVVVPAAPKATQARPLS
jgi:two-component system, OmpR family, phosphate regulon sensor histidine kinase PhoR